MKISMHFIYFFRNNKKKTYFYKATSEAVFYKLLGCGLIWPEYVKKQELQRKNLMKKGKNRVTKWDFSRRISQVNFFASFIQRAEYSFYPQFSAVEKKTFNADFLLHCSCVKSARLVRLTMKRSKCCFWPRGFVLSLMESNLGRKHRIVDLFV